MEEIRIFKRNIEEETLKNEHYRKVLFTTPTMQLVVMKLHMGETIPEEAHRGTQFVRVERGKALVIIEGKDIVLKDDDIIMIPGGVLHYFENIGEGPLFLYNLYSPPEHEPDEIEFYPQDPKAQSNILIYEKEIFYP